MRFRECSSHECLHCSMTSSSLLFSLALELLASAGCLSAHSTPSKEEGKAFAGHDRDTGFAHDFSGHMHEKAPSDLKTAIFNATSFQIKTPGSLLNRLYAETLLFIAFITEHKSIDTSEVSSSSGLITTLSWSPGMVPNKTPLYNPCS